MSLSTKLAGNFTKNVRKRGDDYYCKGRVMIHEGSQSELTARVRGSGFYEVQFAWRNNKLAVWCDCPHFVEQGVPCKHVWATTLAADQHQYLTAAASADKLILDLDALGADGDRSKNVVRAPEFSTSEPTRIALKPNVFCENACRKASPFGS